MKMRFQYALALAALITGFAIAPMRAADLGGDCCADLEVRVAELEAATAKKGNRKISLKISGSLSRGVIWSDGAGFLIAKPTIAANGNVPDSVRLDGAGKIATGISAGYVIDLGLDASLAARQTYVFLDSTTLGQIALGKLNTSSYRAESAGIVDTRTTAPMLDFATLEQAAGFPILSSILQVQSADAVRYDSPVVGGLGVTGSYAPNGGSPFWDAAAHWGGTGAGVDVTVTAAYRNFSATSRSYILAGGLRNQLSGLFVQGGFNRTDGLGPDPVNFLTGQAGISKNMTGAGDTTIYGEYGTVIIAGVSAPPKFMGAGVIQNLDGAAASLYAGWRNYDAGFGPKVNTVVGGLTVHF